MATSSQIPTLLWLLIRNFFELDAIMTVTKVKYNNTLNLKQKEGKNTVYYEDVLVVKDCFSKCEDLEVRVGDRVVVSFINGSKDNPIVKGVIVE